MANVGQRAGLRTQTRVNKDSLPWGWCLVLAAGWVGLLVSGLRSPAVEWVQVLIQGVLLEATAIQLGVFGFFSSAFALWLPAVVSTHCGGGAVAPALLLCVLVRYVFHASRYDARQALADFSPIVLALALAGWSRNYSLSPLAASVVGLASFLWLVRVLPPLLFVGAGAQEREGWTRLRGWTSMHRFAVAFMAPVLVVLCELNPYYSLLCLPVLGGLQRAARAELARAQLLDQERLQQEALRAELDLARVAGKLQVAEKSLQLKQVTEAVWLQLGRELAASESLQTTVEVALACLRHWVPIGTGTVLLHDGPVRLTGWMERAWRENRVFTLDGGSDPAERVVPNEAWAIVYPLEGQGVLYVGRADRGFAEEERYLIGAIASQLSLGLLSTRRYHEKLQIQGQMLQSSKLAAVGQLAAGVAHELNTPLGAALLQLELVEELLGPPPPGSAHKKLGVARRALEHCQGIIARLLYYSREGGAGRRPADLNEIARDTLELFGKPLTDRGIVFSTRFSDLPPVVVNVGEIQQIVTNLLLNARDACLESGAQGLHIEISTRADAQGVYLCVSDQGPGLSEEVAARMFEPFFTTKPLGSGVGLGLSVSSQITQQHDGKLWASSRPEGGACFTLALPRSTQVERG